VHPEPHEHAIFLASLVSPLSSTAPLATTPSATTPLAIRLATLTSPSLATTLLATLGAAAMTLGGCAAIGVVGDGSSVSGGQPNRGWLLDGHRLADEGDGFVSPPQWKLRGLRYATDEMVGLLTGAARQIAKVNAPIRLAVADLSFAGGGPAHTHHRSHQNGRDADLLLYMLDATGRPYASDKMTALDDNGLATDGSGHHLDVPRTWQLVRALVTSPERNVQYLFLNEPLIQLLLDHARAIDEPPWLLELARLAMLEPTGAPHPDHLHVRVFCAPNDLDVGCRELGNLTLLDKNFDGDELTRQLNAELLRRLPVAGSGLAAWRITNMSPLLGASASATSP
jgi:penicillin-insensitive murein DD-endopeptidase